MKTHTIITFFLILLLLAGMNALPMRTYAQNSQNVYDNNSGTGDYAGGGPGWVWLLPLLAIPIIYFIWKGASSPEEDTHYHTYKQALAGVKGGRKSNRKITKKKHKKTNNKVRLLRQLADSAR